LYCDKELGIHWSVAESQLIISEKDKNAKVFSDAEYYE
jgi:dTDP-4-dehydrorhamnose 3,5-epimerase